MYTLSFFILQAMKGWRELDIFGGARRFCDHAAFSSLFLQVDSSSTASLVYVATSYVSSEICIILCTPKHNVKVAPLCHVRGLSFVPRLSTAEDIFLWSGYETSGCTYICVCIYYVYIYIYMVDRSRPRPGPRLSLVPAPETL